MPRCFNGAAEIHRRKYRCMLLSVPSPSCFNGAAEIHRRKSRRSAPSRSAPAKLQWGRRNSSAEINESPCCQGQQSCFNGAAEIHRRKYCIRPPAARETISLQWGRRNSSAEIPLTAESSAEGDRLQWGRRNSSAEIPQIGAFEVGAREASMGPPKFIGGNRPRMRVCVCAQPGFNGAAEIHRRKSKTVTQRRKRCSRFNGAAEIHRRKYGVT